MKVKTLTSRVQSEKVVQEKGGRKFDFTVIGQISILILKMKKIQ